VRYPEAVEHAENAAPDGLKKSALQNAASIRIVGMLFKGKTRRKVGTQKPPGLRGFC